MVQVTFEIVPAICPEELREQDPGQGFGVSLSTTPGLAITGGLGVEQIEESPPPSLSTKLRHRTQRSADKILESGVVADVVAVTISQQADGFSSDWC